MSLDRGMILYEQGRYDLADREFRQELAESPDSGIGHAFLALCLSELKRHDEALHEAEEAVRLEPDLSFSHYARAQVFLDQERLKEAEAAIRQAIELDPENADYVGLLASIEMGRRQWAAALKTAERGLALDPEHPVCINLRAMALVQLGRKEEAAGALGSALASDPENALTHANQGWALLHRGEHEKALEHFREALRLEPEQEWARIGIVEALKSRYLIYRLMLRFFLWMGRQSTAAQWVILLGFVFGRKILADLGRAYPALAPYIWPVLALTFAFLVLTWIASPLFNTLLRFNRFGRLALSREQRLASNWIGGCFILAVVSAVWALVRSSIPTLFVTAYFGFLLVPLAVTSGLRPGRMRWLAVAYTAGVAAAGLPILSMIVLGEASPWRDVKGAVELFFTYFLGGAALSTWLSAILATHRRA